MSDQNPPKGAVRFEWLGRNLGSITLQNPETGNSYQAGFNMDHRFVWIDPKDLEWVESQPQSFKPAPLDEPAAESAAPAKAAKRATLSEPESAAPAVNAPVAESKAKAPTKDA